MLTDVILSVIYQPSPPDTKTASALAEYLEDYASPETREKGYRMIEEELKKIPAEKVRTIAEENIKEIRNSNRRDFRF